METQILDKKKILIVDDDPETCMLLSLLLNRKGYETDVIYTGQEAINRIEEKKPDLIIFDIMMPGLDGWQIYEQLRERENISAICLTALPAGENAARALKMGFSDYVRKPFHNDELLARVETLVNRPRCQPVSPVSSWNQAINQRPTVSLIIPTLNEAENLPLVLPYIPLDWVDEIILVDGRSTDGTPQVAQKLLPMIKVVLEKRPGKGVAMQTGYRAATGEILIVLDADGSHDPREIPRYVKALIEGADFVKGSRFAPGGGTTDMPRYRQFGNGVFMALTNLLFLSSFTDLCYGYHAFWRYCLDSLEISEANGFEIDTALYISAIRSKLRITEVPSFEGYRFFGSGKLKTIPDGLRVLNTIWQGWLGNLKSSSRMNFIGFRGKSPNTMLSPVMVRETETMIDRTKHLGM